MLGSWVLEVAIGLIFVFLLFSTICAALREGIEAWTKTRAAYLERGLREMLHDKDGTGLAKQFYEHPLIFSLYSAKGYKPGKLDDKVGLLPRGDQLPSYIPAKNFSAALIDLILRPPPGSAQANAQADDQAQGKADGKAGDTARSRDVITVGLLREGIGKMENKQVARALLTALDLANDDLNKTCLNLEAWFDASMDRVSGWYKRSTQWIIFGLALGMAGVLNVDAIGIANFLYQNNTARDAVVIRARDAIAEAKAAAAEDTRTPKQKFDQASLTLDALQLPIGWPADFQHRTNETWPHCIGRGALIILGWLLTALAATLGAPFWFDTLNKVMVIRSTVKPYEKSKPEASEDRQKPA
jgi:hypothetical protein